MSTAFSGEEIIEMAVKTEETGYEFYQMALDNASTDELKNLFDYLAKEELKHKETYSGLKDAIGETVQGVPVDWDELDSYIKAMTDSSFFLGGDKSINLAAKASSDKEAIDFAMKFEKDTLLFFYQLAELVKPVNKPIVEKIIQEEKLHITKLAKMKESL